MTEHPACAHCGQPAVYLEPHEIWCVRCGGYFAGDLPYFPAQKDDSVMVGHAVIARVARQVLRESFASVEDRADALAAAVLGVLREDGNQS
jgi:ribosomal protein L37AE/L43A